MGYRFVVRCTMYLEFFLQLVKTVKTTVQSLLEQIAGGMSL